MIGKIKNQIIKTARELHRQGHLAAADGNISVRLDSKKILITGSGVSKARMSLGDFAVVGLGGRILSGNPSSELSMHLAVFQNQNHAKAIVHAHPPTAIAFSIAYPHLKFLPEGAMSELILATGGVPIVDFAMPGTDQMGQNLLPYVSQYKLMILARHGALAWGDSLEECLCGIERLEHSCKVMLKALSLGPIGSLSKIQIKELYQKRKKIGLKLL